MPYRIFINTGEVSGDLQGSLLVAALYRQAQQSGIALEIVATGGQRIAEAGATLLADTTAIGSIGIFEAIPYLATTLRIQQRLKQYFRQQPPDLVVFLDYVSPNLALGGFIRQHFPDIPTVYYIAPQEWVWAISRQKTEKIVHISDRILAIFPGEAAYYEKQGSQVTWVGHPLIDRFQEAPDRQTARQALQLDPQQLMVALIPASRWQELKYIVPVMFDAAQRLQAQLPQVRFYIPLSLEIYRPALQQAIDRYGLNATLVTGTSQTVIAAADLVIAKSGTVNLETALLNVPQVVFYRVNPVTAWIAEHLLNFNAPFISPVNLLVMDAIVPEFLQMQATPDAIATTGFDLLVNSERKQKMFADYQRLRLYTGEPGVCDRAAQEILKLLPGREQ